MRHLTLLFLIFFALDSNAQGQFLISAVRCEHQVNPIGIETTEPGLSWIITSSLKDQYQSAYQVLVASSPALLTEGKADLWNSGKVKTDQSINIKYAGRPLVSRQRCYWSVRVWDKINEASPYSESAFWELGLLRTDDWQAHWISAVPQSDSIPPTLPAPYFRKEFQADGKIQAARLYVSGLGYYEAYLNDKKVGDHVLDPAMTRYDRRVKYVVYDVTNLLAESAENALGIVLGNGWYNQHSKTAWDFDHAPWRNSPSVKAQLEMVYSNGKKTVVSTDNSWKFSFCPIVYNDIHNGEIYDARLELGKWSAPGYDASNWKTAEAVAGPLGKMTSQQMPPIRVVKEITPIGEVRVGNKTIYDFGQNMSGWVRITVAGPAGAQVSIQHGERISEDGSLDMKELSRFIRTGEVQTDRYTLRGGGVEEWHPRFTYHGFQYVEVELSSSEARVEKIVAEVVHTDFETHGYFNCSDTLFNKLHENIKWSYLSNFHGYPTDCPHREKMGWTGDAQLVAEVGLFNFDATTAYLKWLDDFVDEQRPNGQFPGIIPSSGWGYQLGTDANRERGYGPQWEGAFVSIVWYVYHYSGDTAVLRKYYPAAKAYVDYLTAHETDNLIAFGIDDHKQLEPKTGGDILSAGYYYHLTNLLRKMGAILKKENESSHYDSLALSIKQAFNAKYYHPETGMYGIGGQTQLSEALYLGLAEQRGETKVLQNLLKAIEAKGGHIETGVLGTKFMINALMRFGEDRVLYALTSKTDFPGWGYWVKNGATTMYQNWDATQSQNHIMFGTVGDYFYKGLAGIKTIETSSGFKHFSVDPSLDNDVTFTNASLESPYGKIEVQWKKTKNKYTLTVHIPVNTTANVRLPSPTVSTIREGAKALDKSDGIHGWKRVGGQTHVLVSSGKYVFNVLHPQYVRE